MLGVIPLPPDRRDEVIDVFADAFHDYPLMQWVVGPDGDVANRVRRLIAFFVSRRVMRGGPMFGVVDGNRLVGAASLTLPTEPPPPPGITALELQTWRELGDEARARYQTYADTTSPFFIGVGRHHHLNMIGIRCSHKGAGLARPLLDAVAHMSEADPNSTGVSLTTERARNVTLYEHFGYSVIAHETVNEDVPTWGLFRRR
ncbi:MAG TPA: GNAT family N-acetyltransferase [Vicinamibacterales bacterium]|nr:GNAT family N-acetyltransferase [Vicinamibacterales bacterium]